MSTAPKESAKDITARLRDLLRYRHNGGGWIYLEEVRNEGGYKATNNADAIAFGCWPSRGYELHGFEIKASRSDWLNELNKPGKADAFAKFCDYWWVVAPVGIVKASELPPQWGLMTEGGKGLKKAVPAQRRTPEPLDKGFVASFLNRYTLNEHKEFEETKKALIQDAHERGVIEGKRFVGKIDTWKMERLAKKVEEFEEKTGIDLDQYLGHDTERNFKDFLNDLQITRKNDDALELAKRALSRAIASIDELMASNVKQAEPTT